MHMPHEPALHHPEPITWQPATTPAPTHLVPVLQEQAGIRLVTLPDGTRTLAYTHPTPTEPAPIPAPAAGVPAWAKTTALLAPTIGGGIGAAGIGISYAAPGLIAMAEALWAAVALIAAGGAALLLGRTRRAPAATHITQHITATGLFGRATGSIGRR
ncbi:hypothetical protein OHB36_14315 [Streptomyces sp. NBC_00320]|uniref:hypothetical protein n=1 Tax=Streptomyces sp. NBC_00320 TaxID=2975711 RepID=UPI0022533B40|nr:hypothetical protein [Streptomyces sp. NBC_00320]MCX5147929.1 hypothetical protein [Streptomyces sp. NBC_00320]